MMNNKKRLIIYVLWGISSTLLFLYALFPSSLLKQIVTGALKNHAQEYKIEFKDIRPSFPPGLKLTKVDFFYQERELLQADYLKVTPALLSLVSDRKRISLKASSLGGVLQTAVSYKDRPGAPDLFIKTNIDAVQLDKLPLREALQGVTLKGSLDFSGEFDISAQRVKKGEISLHLKSVMVNMKSKLPGVDSLSFDAIQIMGDILDNRLEIKKGTVSGKEVEGEITGAIDLKAPLEASLLSLKGTVKPRQEFLKRIGKRFPVGLLFGKAVKKNGIPFSVRGTIQEPDFSMER